MAKAKKKINLGTIVLRVTSIVDSSILTLLQSKVDECGDDKYLSCNEIAEKFRLSTTETSRSIRRLKGNHEIQALSWKKPVRYYFCRGR